VVLFRAFAETKTMVQSNFGFDDRLKSYSFFFLAPCDVLITVNPSFGLATARQGYTKERKGRKKRWSDRFGQVS
jgi:hypothetical protein